MGNIITAMEQKKPIAIMGRKAELGEHRNDHQLSSVEKFTNNQNIFSFTKEHEIDELIFNIESITDISSVVAPSLIQYLKEVIKNG